MTKRLVIVGAGGHARVLVAAMRRAGMTVSGCIALEKPDTHWPADIEYLGDDEAFGGLDPDTVLLVNGLGSIRSTETRRRVFEKAKAAGFAFQSVVHPGALVDPDVEIGEGAQIMAGAIVQCGAIIGADAIVNTGAVVDHDCQIDAHAHLAPGSRLSGDVRVGEGAHIGTGASVIQGITIGRGALVGAGAAVIRDVSALAIVMGVPARVLPNLK